jgi:uncharacterized protein
VNPAGAAPTRFRSLDFVRGVAVMGILAMNIVAFAMPLPAYFNPLAYGSAGPADLASWAAAFILFDGKMRGLFSLLFGASLLLVMDRAEAAGHDPAKATVRRLLWLFLFGCLHYYLIWYGDILMGYALVGLLAALFRLRGTRALLALGAASFAVQLLIQASFTASTADLAGEVESGQAGAGERDWWQQLNDQFGAPSGEALAEDLSLHLGPWIGLVRDQAGPHLLDPFTFLAVYGWETLGFMLFGMAALRSGFLAGRWQPASYRRIAAWCLGVALPAYAVLAWLQFASGFGTVAVLGYGFTATVPFRVLAVIGYAALLVPLAAREGPWTDRIAAAGRAAFSNYLGTSLAMTFVFYGWGLGRYGSVPRASLWLVVLGGWAAMLLWSKAWLDRFRYGPLEWLWRSLSRMQLQPMLRRRTGQSG